LLTILSSNTEKLAGLIIGDKCESSLKEFGPQRTTLIGV
jgi:hypothetical protein